MPVRGLSLSTPSLSLRAGYFLRYWPARSETFVAREIGELRRRGAHIDVVAMGAREDSRWVQDPDEAATLRPPSGRGALSLLPPLRALSASEARAAFGRALRQLRPKDALRALWAADQGALLGWERVHAHFAGEAAEWAWLVAEILSVPLTVTVHAVDLFVPRPSLPLLLRVSRPVITVCEHHRRWMAERYNVESVVVYCGVPLDVPMASPGEPGARFVSVARDVPKKGLDALVAAVQAVPSASLRLVSDAHRLGGPRVLTGALPPEQVPEILAKSQVFALPCRVAPSGDRDGIPVSLLEAMAAGLPVISTAVAGIPEILDEGVGWLLPPDDAAALSRAVLDALDPASRAARGAAARERLVERGYTIARQVDGLLAAWGLRSGACGSI